MGLDVTSAKPPVDDFKDRSVKIATAQTVITRDVPANGTVIRRMISDAASDDVRLISFCEGALSGYSKSQILKPEDWRSFDWIAQEVELRAIAELCGKRNISAVVGGAHP